MNIRNKIADPLTTRTAKWLLAVALLIGVSSRLASQPNEPVPEPAPSDPATNRVVEILSGRVVFKMRTGETIFTGDVVVKDEKMTLTCEVLRGQRRISEAKPAEADVPIPDQTAAQESQPAGTGMTGQFEFEWLVAETNVSITIEGKDGVSIATGQKLTYTNATDTLVLTGAPYAKTPRIIFEDYEALIYDRAKEEFEGKGRGTAKPILQAPIQPEPPPAPEPVTPTRPKTKRPTK